MVQITKYKNFIKLDFDTDTSWGELEDIFTDYNSKFAIEMNRLCNMLIGSMFGSAAYNSNFKLPEQSIHYFETDYSIYAFLSRNNIIHFYRVVYYDNNNPYNEEDFVFRQELDPLQEDDFLHHIDEIAVRINMQKDEYGFHRIKHGLYHHSSIFGKIYCHPSSDLYLKNKEYMLSVVNQLFEEVRNIENIESIIDLSAFDVVPIFHKNDSLVYKKQKKNK